MIKLILTTALLFSIVIPAAMAQSSYQTPEYSGPNARIDSGHVGNNGTPPIVRSRQAFPTNSNDAGIERRIETRNEQIQSEMDLRREEARQRNDVNE